MGSQFPDQGWNLAHSSESTEPPTTRPPGHSVSHLLLPTNPFFLFFYPTPLCGLDQAGESPAPLRQAPSRPNTPLSSQIHSLCYNDCTFSVNTTTRTFDYNFLALGNTVSLAGGPSFTSKGLKYFHHFTLSLCGNQVRCAGADGVRTGVGAVDQRPERTQEIQAED